MKTNYELYELNSSVYCISRILNDGKISDHCAIYDAIVESISIYYDEKRPKHAKKVHVQCKQVAFGTQIEQN